MFTLRSALVKARSSRSVKARFLTAGSFGFLGACVAAGSGTAGCSAGGGTTDGFNEPANTAVSPMPSQTGVAPVSTSTTGGGGTQPTGVAPTTTNTGVNPVNPTTSPTNSGGFIAESDTNPIIAAPTGSHETVSGQIVSGAVCNSLEVGFQKVIPTVMLVLDRSTSMFKSSLANGGFSGTFGTFEDRWEGLRAAVAGLEPYSKDVQFGALTYTGYQNGTCPELQGGDIQIATNNFAEILALLPVNTEAIPDKASETPTAESMQAGIDALLAVEAEGPKYLVLITDGLPDMCAGNPELINKGPWCSHDPAFAVAQAAFEQGIKTYVIGMLGNPSDQNEAAAGEYFLNGIAHAGQGLELEPPTEDLHCIQQESTIARDMMPDNDFYTDWRPWAAATYGADGYTYAEDLYFAIDDGAALGAQLGSVVATTRSCSFEMDDAVVRAQANLGGVQLEAPDGTLTTLTYDDANGWALDPTNDYTVVIQGTSCDGIKADAVKNVKIQFPCEVRVPRVR